MDKFWIIDLVIDGERVLDIFTQGTCDFARALAKNHEGKEESDGHPQGNDRPPGRIPE